MRTNEIQEKQQASLRRWLCAQCAHRQDCTPETDSSWRLSERSKLFVHGGGIQTVSTLDLTNIKSWQIKLSLVKKSQNCVKAAIVFVCTTCKKETTFVCSIAVDNFCLQYCNLQLFYALLKLQLRTFVCIIVFPLTMYLDTITMNIFCIVYCNWQLLLPLFLYTLLQITNFLWNSLLTIPIYGNEQFCNSQVVLNIFRHSIFYC